MKKEVIYFVLALAFIFSAGLASANTNVTDCGTLDTENELYTLNQPINSSFNCLNINASNITLDCQGYNITFGNASGGKGIFVDDGGETGYDNITIQNCILVQNESGSDHTAIFFGESSEDGIIYNNSIIVFGYDTPGIVVESNSVNINISLNNITTFGELGSGIVLSENGSEADMRSNTITTSGEDASGIKIGDECSNGLVYNNTITTSGDWSLSGGMGGIWLESGTIGMNVSSNNVIMSGYANAGLWVWSCYNHSIENNNITASGLAGNGFFLSDLEGVNITSNTINIIGNYGDGIYSYISDNSIIFYSNVITTSGISSTGFSLIQDSNSNLSSNNITTSGIYSYGLFSNQSHNNTLENNRIRTGQSTSYVLYITTSGNQSIYNNLFNTSTSGSGVYIINSNLNYFNTTSSSSSNIIGKTSFGGNFWTNTEGTGYSDYCANMNGDYFCDSSYRVFEGRDEQDYLPLTNYQTNISTCGVLDTKRRYVLNQSFSSDGTCFNVTSNGVFLDLAGNTITGNTTGYGVNITGYNQTTIFNGTIMNFSNGIYVSLGVLTNISHMNVSSTEDSANAIALTYADNSTIASNTIITTGASSNGIYVTDSPYISITSNNATTTGDGATAFYIGSSSDYFTFYNNFANTTGDSSAYGVNLDNCSYGNFSDNEIITYGNDADGVYIESSSNNNTIFSNIISPQYTDDITLTGLYIGDSTGNNASFNNITGLSNQSFGIYINGETNDTFVYGNKIIMQGYLGVGLAVLDRGESAGDITITNNNILSNDSSLGIAIYFSGSRNNLIYNNIFNSTQGSYSGIEFYQFTSEDNLTNQFSTTKTAGTNIVGKSYIGGNYWTTPTGTGYSDTCTNLDDDYICDTAYTAAPNNIDHYPLTLHITAAAASANDDSSSPGGTSTLTYKPLKEELAKGYTKTLFAGQGISFEANDESHLFKLEEIDGSEAVISISSETQEATFEVGEEKMFDVNSDDYYDLSVRLNSLDDYRAGFTVKTINEKIPQEISSENQTQNNKGYVGEVFGGDKKGSSLIFFGLLIAIIAIVVAYFLNKKTGFLKNK